MKASNLEVIFWEQLKQAGLSVWFEREYRFAPPRRWRMDFADKRHMIAVEIQGGTWTQGGHSRGKGHANDCEKAAEAVLAGWRVFQATGDQVKNGTALAWIHRAVWPVANREAREEFPYFQGPIPGTSRGCIRRKVSG